MALAVLIIGIVSVISRGNGISHIIELYVN